MNRLIRLELRRTSIKPYNTAALIIAVSLLAFLYLLAAIPKLDPAESDMVLFTRYGSLTGIINLLSMVVFTVFAAVMYAKVVVEEYSGSRAILLFSYPIRRNRIFFAKASIVFFYTICAMFVSGAVVYTIFFFTENLFQLCNDTLSIRIIAKTILSLLGNSILAGALGSISLWFGFWKRSISATIVSAAIIAVVVCQFMAAVMGHVILLWTLAGIIVVVAVVLMARLCLKINEMEV